MNKTNEEPKRKKFTITCAGATHKGKVREDNEDAFGLDKEVGLFVLSDGMGGHRGGKLASQIVTEDLPVMIETGFDKLKSHSQRAIRSLIKKNVTIQSRNLMREGISESGYKDMGATVVLTFVHGSRAYIGSVGDSRIYRFRNNRLVQISKDHTVISELLERGRIKPEQAEDHPAQGQITRYIGMEEKLEPYIHTFLVKNGDRLIMCTDGLTDMVSDKTISSVLRKYKDPQEACDELVRKANAAGGQDNITVIVINFSGMPSLNAES